MTILIGEVVRLAGWIGLAWGFAEATLFFVIPDVFVMLVGLHDAAAATDAAWAAVGGSVVGGSVVVAASRRRPDTVSTTFLRLPGISRPMVDSVSDQVARHGSFAMITGPLRGIPYKLYAAAMADRHMLTIVLFTIIARAIRLLPAAWLGGWLGREIVPALGWTTTAVTAAYVGLVAVGYGLYFLLLRRRYGRSGRHRVVRSGLLSRFVSLAIRPQRGRHRRRRRAMRLRPRRLTGPYRPIVPESPR